MVSEISWEVGILHCLAEKRQYLALAGSDSCMLKTTCLKRQDIDPGVLEKHREMGRDQALTQVDDFIALNCTFKTECLAGLSGWLTSENICNADIAIARRGRAGRGIEACCRPWRIIDGEGTKGYLCLGMRILPLML